MNVITKLTPPVPSPVYDTYWRFAVERQNIFFRRHENTSPPWTSDPIFLTYKFTNAYRAADRVSQHLIKQVLYTGRQSAQDIFFRCVLFKIFNRISTWDLIRSNFGEVSLSTGTFEAIDSLLTKAKTNGQQIFSAAYIMPSRSGDLNNSFKHRNYLSLLARMLKDNLPEKLQTTKSMGEGYVMLRGYPLIGDFLAYQFITDINYSTLTDFSEMEFVMPGPGARNGIRKCFTNLGSYSESDIIRFVTDRQNEEFNRLGLKFRTLWGRPLQLIDCQNLFCEVDKYSRVAHPEIKGLDERNRIKQKFTANSQVVEYSFPAKWGLKLPKQNHS